MSVAARAHGCMQRCTRPPAGQEQKLARSGIVGYWRYIFEDLSESEAFRSACSRAGAPRVPARRTHAASAREDRIGGEEGDQVVGGFARPCAQP
jgi:hypothetical protein